MKTINDFKIVNKVAVLEGISYADEAKVVDEYLKQNTNILHVSVITEDGRYFALKNDKLIYSNEKTFINPYYHKNSEQIEANKELEPLGNLLPEDRILALEKTVGCLNKKLEKLIHSIKNMINENLS